MKKTEDDHWKFWSKKRIYYMRKLINVLVVHLSEGMGNLWWIYSLKTKAGLGKTFFWLIHARYRAKLSIDFFCHFGYISPFFHRHTDRYNNNKKNRRHKDVEIRKMTPSSNSKFCNRILYVFFFNYRSPTPPCCFLNWLFNNSALFFFFFFA